MIKAVKMPKNAQLLLACTARTGENSWKLFFLWGNENRNTPEFGHLTKIFPPFFLNEGTRNPVNSVGY
jgi:hypothetical protein